uniref:Serine/threonine-protein phosphatase 2A regulatory subunit B'' subunit gamma n=1 Tax=Cacopsylla melanoneura TaxID=428564 RepID=A0A8D8XZH8_9HEMI
MDLKSLLEDSVSKLEISNYEKKTNEELEVQVFNQVYNSFDNTSLKEKSIIPSFYIPLPKPEDILGIKLLEESRSKLLKNISKDLLDNNELKNLYTLLCEHQTVTDKDEGEKFINYKNFLKVKEVVIPKCRKFFTPAIFAKLQQGDPDGRISMTAFFNYVMRKTWHYQTRVGLSLYDIKGQGYLRETDLETYILELIPTLPKLEDLEESFYNFYICTAVRKFFFFLDPLRTHRVKIQDVLACGFLDDLLELRDEGLSVKKLEQNWFSAASALRIYGQYLHLDKDHNGILSKEELAAYGTGTLTSVFIERVFQESLTFETQMDYKTYLDFVLALENKGEPQALQYLFRFLDIRHQGYLDSFTLLYFFKAISDEITDSEQEPIKFEDVKDEIFDMAKPKDPCKITLQDLIACGQGELIVSILIDVNGFWSYESREDGGKQLEEK